MHVNHLFGSGRSVAVQTTIHAVTHAGDSYDMQTCWVYGVDDDVITEIREYLDTYEAARVLRWDAGPFAQHT